ncbi:hypothetical protein ACFQ48_18085 [Hymenobacter caeli]|uniref:Uncharacterized protein n=1 Tax=Hymenobacter caeli TaxID=2735894 RepID=A0ABX2FWV7_9BACT|nr:hypothetical protein [Hymenobacter caeli]NRT20882.1 hypothetical protein [Hymenobacter caeli]
MLYAGWELLNWVALYLVARAVFKALSLVVSEWGILKAGALFIILLSTCHGRSPAPAAGQATSVAATGDASGVDRGPHLVTIAEEPMGSVVLLVTKGALINPTGLQVARSVSGTFPGGHRWEPVGLGSYHIEKDRFTYGTTELLHWQLLGTTVYTQVKDLHGTVAIK